MTLSFIKGSGEFVVLGDEIELNTLKQDIKKGITNQISIQCLFSVEHISNASIVVGILTSDRF